MGVNKVILVGNVGKDPEVKRLDNGTTYARLSLATSESYKDKEGNKVEKTEWHNLVFWRGLAEVVEKWVKKGQQLYVEGSIKTTISEEDGEKKYFTDIVVKDMQMIGSKKDSEQQSAVDKVNSAGVSKAQNTPADDNEPLPF